MKQILTTLFTLILFVSTTCGQTKEENETIQQITTYLSELEKVGFNGSVLVELNGKQVISEGYGFSDKERQLKNSSTTIFDIGSITKQFTAAAVLKLEMQGKLSTDDKLSKFFENIPKDKEIITIHDLLRHQSGLISNVGKDFEKISKEEFLNKVLSSELRFEVGTSFSYSNIGYSLLAMIIEKVSGQTYETYLYENLWKPAQMKLTGYSRPEFDRDLIAVGYYKDDRIWGKPTDKEWDKTAPYWHMRGNGGILSTTEDLYKWHKALTGDLILSNEAKNKLYQPKIRAEEDYSAIYAYGWDVSETNRNTTRVWHNGTNNFLYADFLRYIDEGTTLIMLSNKSHSNFDELNQEISQIIFNPKYIPVIPVADNEINRNFTNYIIGAIQEFGLEKANEEYQKKANSQSLLEFMMRNEGLNNLYNSKPDIAMQIFQMNVFVHPNVAKALQALGEGYMETGKKELALKFFNKSLSINPDNPFANKMIKRLEE
ncbi:serine hydrolase domain-containing protein [Gillisia hiemivivida]|uniref:Serine hydrolase n=1 Tax=Gillisia hiemivivida TaxID=291190 RepID=A0A5C6ZWZ4_9FLAO|nr:serine hydrolase [Gillisia hiemivivida]TXD95523.1 serine hydrolase [Gillisia hiemivivida]